MRKPLMVLGLAALVLAGCQSQMAPTVTGIKPGDYPAMLPYKTSDMRGKHVGLLNDIDIRIQLEQGLMDLSKQYFNPKDVAYTTHKFLDYDELDATDGSRGLLGTLRDNNPNGLNPGSDEPFDTGNGIVNGPILINDLYELDFYDGNQLKGVSIGLAVSDAATLNGQRVEITREKMEEFLKAAGTKITTYMRERFNEVTPNIPIVIGAYQLNTQENPSDKGGYIYLEYFDGTKSDFTEIKENYMIVPSAAFSEAQPEMAEQFDAFKQEVAQILSDTSYTTAQAQIIDGKVRRLTITVSAYGKTVGEIRAVLQAVAQKLSLFTSLECQYKVILKNNNDICALMDREVDKDKPDVLSVY